MKHFLGLLLILFFIGTEGQQISIVPVSKLQTGLSGISQVSFSSQSTMLAAADKKGNLELWDMDNLRRASQVKLDKGIILVEFIRNNEIVVVTDGGKAIFLSDKDLNITNEVDLNDKLIRAEIDPDRTSLSYLTKENRLKIFNLGAGMQQASIDLSARLNNPLYIGYDRFGQQLVTLAKDGTALVCNPVNQRVLREAKLRSDQFSGSASVIHSAGSNKSSDLFVVGVQEVFIPKGGLQGNQPERRNSILTYDWDTSEEIKQINTNYAVDELVLGPGPASITYYSKNYSSVNIVDLSQGAEISQITIEEQPRIIKISGDDA